MKSEEEENDENAEERNEEQQKVYGTQVIFNAQNKILNITLLKAKNEMLVSDGSEK